MYSATSATATTRGTKMYSRFFLILVGSLSLSVLIHSVPEACAFAQRPTPRFPKPRSATATTVVQQSSRALFSPSQILQKDEKRFQDVRESQEERQITESDILGMQEFSKAKPMTMDSILYLLQKPFESALDRRKLRPAFATTFLAVVAACSLLGTGWFVAFARHADWWIQNAFFTYQTNLVSNPLRTKVGTGAVLAILGDALAQSTTNVGAPYDKRRAASFAVFDSCYRVFQHYMFPAVITMFQGKILGRLGIVSSISAAIERTMVYQLLIVPLFYYPFFFAFTGFVQGLTFKESLDRARSQFFRCWRRNLLFWIPTQMVLFGAIDENWQIPFACLMGILWSTILSLTAGKTKNAPANEH